VEIKSGATFVSDWFDAVRKWQQFAGDAALLPWIIYGGSESYLREGARVLAGGGLAEGAFTS